MWNILLNFVDFLYVFSFIVYSMKFDTSHFIVEKCVELPLLFCEWLEGSLHEKMTLYLNPQTLNLTPALLKTSV